MAFQRLLEGLCAYRVGDLGTLRIRKRISCRIRRWILGAGRLSEIWRKGNCSLTSVGRVRRGSVSLAMGDFPTYAYPGNALWGLAISLLAGKRRSFRRDALACVQALRPPLKIYGAENIPKRGPVLIVFNHYFRPGFRHGGWRWLWPRSSQMMCIL